jgi:hypothetical protein
MSKQLPGSMADWVRSMLTAAAVQAIVAPAGSASHHQSVRARWPELRDEVLPLLRNLGYNVPERDEDARHWVVRLRRGHRARRSKLQRGGRPRKGVQS